MTENKLPVKKGRHTVNCRPAVESDTQRMFEMTKTIWDGEDYIPHVWAEWLADPDGKLTVAEYHRRIVGFGKLTRLTDNDWWLEGLRVDPDFEGHGIASQLHDDLIETWKVIGGGAIRLATSSKRIQVHRICSRSGLEKIGEYRYYKADAINNECNAFQAIAGNELDELMSYTHNNPYRDISFGLIDLGWHWAAPTKELIVKTVNRGHAFWWRKESNLPEGILLYWEDEWDTDQEARQIVPTIQLILCPPEMIKDCLIDFRSLAGELGSQQAAWFAPVHGAILPILESAGYKTERENNLYIFAKYSD